MPLSASARVSASASALHLKVVVHFWCWSLFGWEIVLISRRKIEADTVSTPYEGNVPRKSVRGGTGWRTAAGQCHPLQDVCRSETPLSNPHRRLGAASLLRIAATPS